MAQPTHTVIDITREVRAAPGLYAGRCPDTNLVKLGRSKNVASRLATHRTGPLSLTPVLAMYTSRPLTHLEAEAFEQLHRDGRRAYHPTHPGNEWTDLSDVEIKALFHWLATRQQVKRASAVDVEHVPLVQNVYDGPIGYAQRDIAYHPPIESGVVPRSA